MKKLFIMVSLLAINANIMPMHSKIKPMAKLALATKMSTRNFNIDAAVTGIAGLVLFNYSAMTFAPSNTAKAGFTISAIATFASLYSNDDPAIAITRSLVAGSAITTLTIMNEIYRDDIIRKNMPDEEIKKQPTEIIPSIKPDNAQEDVKKSRSTQPLKRRPNTKRMNNKFNNK